MATSCGRSLRSKQTRIKECAEERGLLKLQFKNSYIGHGVFAREKIMKNDLVCHYKGQLLHKEEWTQRLEKQEGTFMFFFQFKGNPLCIDSTMSSGAGRMINDDHKHPNCKVKVMSQNGAPQLAVIAIKDIERNSEITYDYGDPTAPWRKKNAVRKELYQEPEFLYVRPDIVTYSRDGTEIGRFSMQNPICLIGKSRDADIIVTLPGVKDVHCQLELCQGEVLFTDDTGVERFLHRNDNFFIMDREFKIDIPAEPIASMHMDSDSGADDTVVNSDEDKNYHLDESDHIADNSIADKNNHPEDMACDSDVDENNISDASDDRADSSDSNKNNQPGKLENTANDIDCNKNVQPDELENIANDINCYKNFLPYKSESTANNSDRNKNFYSDKSETTFDKSDADKNYHPDESEDNDSDVDENYHPDESDDIDIADDSDADENYHPDESENESSEEETEEEIITNFEKNICEPSESETDDESGYSAIFPQLKPEKTLTFQHSKQNSKGNIDNKVHCCLYCEKMFQNIARHLGLVHSNKHDVARVLLLPKKSADRRRAWSKIVNQGDFNHNYNVFDQGHGMVIPKYRIRKDRESGMHVPCMFCRALYIKTDLWKHQKTCGAKGDQNVQYGPVRSGKLLMPKRNASKELHENVLVKMKDDDIKTAVLSDAVIIQYGNNEYQEKCHINHNRGYLSNRMRELGRLLRAAQELDQKIKSISDLMINKNWDLLVKSVKQVANFDEKTRTFGIPSLADKLGQHMKNCAEILRFEALKKDDHESIKSIDTFIEMHRTGWSKEVSSVARYTLKENKYNKPQLLPVVADIVQLNKFLDESGEQLCEEIKANPNCYPNLAKVLLAKIILFNRKRSGEAERMTLKQFREAKSGEIQDPVIKSTLSEFEQRLCRSHLRVEIRGKKERNVPVLLTERMVKCLNILIEYRSVAGVNGELFVFARPGNSESPYRGCDALRGLAQSCVTCTHPENITSTKLRKQLATCAQLLNMRDFEQDLLATFQGHDIRVHRQFYRLPDSTLQIAKISKVLHSINTGTIQKYKGCNFDDIEFEENETIEEESDDEETDEHNVSDADGIDRSIDDADDECDVTEDDVPSSGRKGVKRQRGSTKGASKQPLNVEEKKILEREFARFIKEQKVPGKSDIINIVRSKKVFQKYEWKKIKYAVYNVIMARRKKTRFL